MPPDEDTDRHRLPPLQEPTPVPKPPPLPDNGTALGRLTNVTLRLESKVGALESDSRELRDSIMATGEKLDGVAGQTRDLALIKRIAVGVLLILIPYVGHEVYRGIEDSHRLGDLEADVDEHTGAAPGPATGHRDVDEDIAAIKSDVSDLRTEEALERRVQQEQLGRVQKILENIQKHGVPYRRGNR